MKKLFQISLVFFILIIIVEVGYLFYLIKNQPSTNKQPAKNNYQQAVNESKINYVKNVLNQKIPFSKFSHYYIVYEITGRLTRIDTDGSFSPNKNIMKFGLWIQPEDSSESLSFYLSPKFEQNLKIFTISDKGETISEKKDLQVGNLITIQEFRDVTLNQSNDVFIIIKINKQQNENQS